MDIVFRPERLQVCLNATISTLRKFLLPPEQPFRFLDLPPELRNQIYEYIILNGSTLAQGFGGIKDISYYCCDPMLKKNHILRICRQIKYEAQPILLKRTFFWINIVDATVFARNVYNFDTSNKAALQNLKGHLTLSGFSHHGVIDFDILPLIRALLSAPAINFWFFSRIKYMRIFGDHEKAWLSAIENDLCYIRLTERLRRLSFVEIGFRRDAPVPFLKTLEELGDVGFFTHGPLCSPYEERAMYDYMKALGWRPCGERWQMVISKSV